MFSKPLFKFLLRFKIQHMCSIPLPHSCAAYLSMRTYENQGRCSPCLRLLWSGLQDGFTTSDPHIDSHHFECLFHCAAAFCTSKSCHKLGWLKHGVIFLRYFRYEVMTAGMNLQVPAVDWHPEGCRFHLFLLLLDPFKARVFFFPPDNKVT